MSKTCLGAVATIVALTIAASATPLEQKRKLKPVETGPGTLAAARKYLEGRWSLVSFELFPPGKPPIRLTEQAGAGTLTYDDFGNLTMDIRVDDPTATLLESAGIRTTDGLLSTKGRTVIDLQAHTITYMLEGQPAFGAPSGPIALNRPRHWVVEGNLLTLTTKGADGMPLSVSRWEKKTPE